MKIAKIKQQVLDSKEFFGELWDMYSNLNVSTEGIDMARQAQITKDKSLFVVITAEGGFSGDIDRKLIDWMLKQFDPKNTEIIAIGNHGVTQLRQNGVEVASTFDLPTEDNDMDLQPMMQEIVQYPETTVYYQTYVSLSVQDVKRIQLKAQVDSLSQNQQGSEPITSHNYIFEPSEAAVVSHLESSMLSVALAQVILESKLAQHASRFKAMTAAHDKAKESRSDLITQFNRAKRALADERSKEIINAMRLSGANV
jgi:F-type H+-transporting ATPase subunit gamma